MVRVVLIAVLATASCYQPELVDCVTTCNQSGICADGLSCVAGYCRTGESTERCTGPVDASVDSPLDGPVDASVDADLVNDPPTNSVPATQSFDEDVSHTFSSVGANQITVSDPDAGQFTVSVTLTATNGLLTLNGTTGLSFQVGDGIADSMIVMLGTIDNINLRLDGLVLAPTPNFNGASSIVIVTNDQGQSGTGGPMSDTDSVPLNVVARNDNPDAANDTAMIAEDSAATAIGVLANDSFLPDAGETLSITVVTQPTLGAVAITGGGTGLTFQPTPNVFGVTSFSYTIADGNGGTDTATVMVTVPNVNDAPDAIDDSLMVAEDAIATPVSVLLNDLISPDVGETLTIFAVTQASGGAVAITGAGAGLTFLPTPDFVGMTSFTYTISDGNGGTDTATVAVTVTNVNDPPVAIDDMTSVPEDSVATAIDVLANDTIAPDTGETLTITQVTQPASGTVAITGGGTGVTFQPAANFVGVAMFTYTISDGNGGTDTATASVTVTNVDDLPDAVDDAATVAQDAAATAVLVLANDTTIDPGETLTITQVTQPIGGTVVITGGGTGLTFQPTTSFFGMTTFTYTISDGTSTDTATVTMTVTQGCPPAPMAGCTAGNTPVMPYCFVRCTSMTTAATARTFTIGTWHIAKIEDATEHSAAVLVATTLSWIGLQQTTTTGSPAANWVWHDSVPIGFTAWGGGMPNDGDNVENGQEQCGAIGAGGWGDEPCGVNLPFIIEPF